MYYNQVEIKKNLDALILHQFGEPLLNSVNLLIDAITGKDIFIDNHLLLNLQNLLMLDRDRAAYFIQIAIDLANSSIFAPVLLLEKLPTLFFYGVEKEVCQLLSHIKHYGSRAVAYYVGTDRLNSKDGIINVLEQSSIPFYKALLHAVNQRHEEFGVCCAMIMRCSAKTQTVITTQQIPVYLDMCALLIKKYGTKFAELYIANAHHFIPQSSLNQQVTIIDALVNKSLAYAEFSLMHPHPLTSSHASASELSEKYTEDDLRQMKIDILQNENYPLCFEHALLFNDPNFMGLVFSWPNLNQTVKANILFQLNQANYKAFIQGHPALKEELAKLDEATQSRWLSSWMYSEETIDLIFIRKRMKILLQKNQFSIPPKTIVNTHKDIFDRSNPQYDLERVSTMVNILLKYAVESKSSIELTALSHFLAGNPLPLRELLSSTSLVFQAWERDPWTDYGRSDELFSCTSLGENNAGNAPGFLSDLNLNNIDIWSNGIRVGRIHLCLIKDSAGQALLLLDCVDGTERVIGSKKKVDLILKAVIEYTKWLGLGNLKINYDIDYNLTPKKFIASIEQTLQGQQRLDFASRCLTLDASAHLIPYPCQTFTESFMKNNGALIRGALLSIEKTYEN